jgi:flagellar basal-body rod protein FlgF
LGENETTVAIIGRIKMVKAGLDNLEKRFDGLMHTKDGSVLVADANASLVQGALEGSNVNAVSALVEMIELARNFELQTKVMKNADDNSAVSAKLMQMA